MLEQSLEAYEYAADNPVGAKDPAGSVTECKQWTNYREEMPNSCGIWPYDYSVLKRLGVHLSSPKYDETSSGYIYGPVEDFISQKGASPKNISIAFHLIQDDLYHYMSYSGWIDAWTWDLAVMIQLCGGTGGCLPPPQWNHGHRVDGTVAWLEQQYQNGHTPKFTTGDISTLEACGDLSEWLGAVGVGICAIYAGVNAA